MQTHTIPQYQTLQETCPLDFVILSVHRVENGSSGHRTFRETRARRNTTSDIMKKYWSW